MRITGVLGLRVWSGFLVGTCLVALYGSTFAFAQPAQTADGWSRSSEGQGRTLSYSSNVDILGQNSRLDARFYCNSERTKMSTGAIGFELEIHDPDKLKGFQFDDFEG